MQITRRSMRAARAFLDLKQVDVENATGVSAHVLSRYELGKSGLSEKSKDAVVSYYEASGIEFMEYEGIRRKASGPRILEGTDGFKRFIDDVYETMRHGGEVCVTNVDERQFERWQGHHAHGYLSKMAEIENLTFRILVCEGDDYRTAAQYAQYRELPKAYFGDVPTYIYGDKKAEILFGEDTVTIYLFDNQPLAEAERRQFRLLWEKALA